MKPKIILISALFFYSLLGFGQEFTMTLNNTERSYLLHIPQNYESEESLPLLMVLHGGGWTKEEADTCYGFTEHADTTGYVVVYPQGINNRWSDGDVSFISTLIDTLNKNYNINTRQVYITGHSQGGLLVNILARELSDKIAAFADISGFVFNGFEEQYKTSLPVPYLKIHGTNDPEVNYEGGDNYFSVDSLVSFWQGVNNSQTLTSSEDIPDINTSDSSTVTKYTWGEGDSEVVFYKITNGGHDIPNWTVNNAMGFTNRDINTPEVLWNFFKNHKLKGVNISYIANAGFLLEGSTNKILIDALFSNGFSNYLVPSVQTRELIQNNQFPFNNIDLHLVSHNHGDHFNSNMAAKQLVNSQNTYLLGTTNTTDLLKSESEYSAFSNRTITILPEYNNFVDTLVNNTSVKVLRLQHDTRPEFENLGFLFKIDGMKILHVGDYTGDVLSELDTFNLKEEDIDIALISAYCYSNGQERMEKVRGGINARHTILYHIENKELKKVSDSFGMDPQITVFQKSLDKIRFVNSNSIIESALINKAPELINNIPDTSATVGEDFTFRIPSNSFLDSDELIYDVKLIQGVSEADLPEWLTYNDNMNMFLGIPMQEGTLQIKVEVIDRHGAGTSDMFNISVKDFSVAIVNNKVNGGVKVYPNPAKTIIRLEASFLSSITNYQLVDMCGKIVKQGKLESASIDIAGLINGLYMLNLYIKEGIVSKTVMVE